MPATAFAAIAALEMILGRENITTKLVHIIVYARLKFTHAILS
jgi:hypothetical protein